MNSEFDDPFLASIPLYEALRIGGGLLHAARYDDDMTRLASFLDEGVSVNMAWKNDTPLVAAASCGNAKAVDFLLERGADVNLLDGNGYSAIGMAVNGKYDELARRLFEAGADPTLGRPSARDLGFSG